MITISAVIGVTIFYIDGEALEVAGPGGTLLALVIIGIVAICVMEGISEMIQCFPAPNALMEYVKAFVDPDLAWVVGVMYWYIKSRHCPQYGADAGCPGTPMQTSLQSRS